MSINRNSLFAKRKLQVAKKLWKKFKVGLHDHETTMDAIEEAYQMGVSDCGQNPDLFKELQQSIVQRINIR